MDRVDLHHVVYYEEYESYCQGEGIEPQDQLAQWLEDHALLVSELDSTADVTVLIWFYHDSILPEKKGEYSHVS